MHFLLLGALIFAAWAAFTRNAGSAPASRQIVMTPDDLRQLQIGFAAKWQRPPTQRELIALLESRIREEILYREALALGLDKDDTIVKRRMAQKMEFLAEDVSKAREPAIDELRAWFAKNSERFAQPGRVTLRHIYFSPDKRGARTQDDASKALPTLAGKPASWPGAAQLGDRFMFQDYLPDRDPGELAKEFGPAFARAVFELKPGSWQGPVESGYGWHLVFVESAVPGRVPAFEEIEPDLKTAWKREQHDEAWRKAYDAMRARYEIILPVAPEMTPPAGQPEVLPP